MRAGAKRVLTEPAARGYEMRSPYTLDSIIPYIGLALYKAFIKLGVKPYIQLGVEPYVEFYRELHTKLRAEPLYAELIFGFIFKGLIDGFV